MPQPIGGLIQTIVALRDLQLREAAQRLQEQQLGISQGQEHIGGQGAFQNLLQGMQNPQAMAPFLSQFTGTTGLGQDALAAIIAGTPPSVATTKGAAVASGARQLGGSADQQAAQTEMTGMTPGQAEVDKFRGLLTHQAADYYSTLSPGEQQGFQEGVLSQVATGQDIGSATLSRITADELTKMPPGKRRQLVEIGKGMAPSASESAQLQLGWANSRQQARQQEMALALEDVKVHAGISQARRELEKDAFKEVNDLIEKQAQLRDKWTASSPTLTDQGIEQYREGYNAYNQQLRQAAPTVYGPNGTHPLLDVPGGGTPGATGVLPFLGAKLQGR